MNDKLDVDWVLWADETPEEEGYYLSYWSNGDIETVNINVEDLDKEAITAGWTTLTHWAQINIAKPKTEGSK